MVNSTSTFWDVDGVSLQTFARNIATLGGDRDTVPAWRGSDRTFAYKGGATPRPMVADSRTITLLMWANGANSDGTIPASSEVEYNANRRELKRLFWKPGGATFNLTKRWNDVTGLRSATAVGRVSGTMAAEMHGPYGSAFAVDVFLPDPWFYGPEVITAVPLNVPTVITNDGDDMCAAIKVVLTGQLTNPTLTNQTPVPQVWVKLGVGIALADVVTVDVDAETVKRTSDLANLIGSVTHSGARAWMGLQRGANTVLLTATAGAGSGVVKHRPMYF